MNSFTHVILYGRFSSDAQSEGTSLERQFGDMGAYLEREGLQELPILRVSDDGKSAFHGDHRSKGEMGRIEREILNGEHQGAIFVCENMDRFTRQGRDAGLDLLRSYLDNGVTVQSLVNRICRAYTTLPLGEWLEVAIAFEQAQKFSENLSNRTKASWRIRAANSKASGKATRKDAAPWLKVADDYSVTVIEERGALVRRMFELSDSGMGEAAIARLFEKEEIPTWSVGRKNRAAVWQRTSIRKVLDSRKVLGEFQPMKKVGGKLVADGEPWVGHFPQIVSTELFNRVNGNRAVRMKTKGGRKSARLVNLFSTMVKCSCCGGNYRYSFGVREGTDKTIRGKRYVYKRDCGSLYCDTAQTSKGKKCQNRGYWAYLTFEDAVTKALLHLAMDDTAFSNRGEVGRVRSLIADRERELEVAQAKAKRLWDAFASTGSENAMKLAEETDVETRALQDNIEGLTRQLHQASGRASSAEHLARVEDIRKDLYCEDTDKRIIVRRKVMTAMAALINTITINDRTAHIRLNAGAGSLLVDRKGKVSGLNLIKNLNDTHPDFARRYLDAEENGTLPWSGQKVAR